MLQFRYSGVQKGFIRISSAFYCPFTLQKGVLGEEQQDRPVSSGRMYHLAVTCRNLHPGKSPLSTIQRNACDPMLSIFLLFDFQIQRDVLTTVKTRNCTSWRFGAIFFCVDFVVSIWV